MNEQIKTRGAMPGKALRWYVSRNGETVGPVDETQVRDWVRAGMRDAQVRDEFGGAWMPIEKSPFASLLGAKRGWLAAVGLGLAAGVAGFAWAGPIGGAVGAAGGAIFGLLFGNLKL